MPTTRASCFVSGSKLSCCNYKLLEITKTLNRILCGEECVTSPESVFTEGCVLWTLLFTFDLIPRFCSNPLPSNTIPSGKRTVLFQSIYPAYSAVSLGVKIHSRDPNGRHLLAADFMISVAFSPHGRKESIKMTS